MCTEKYAMPTNANLGSTCTHLTNYSINKDSEAFVQPEDVHDDTSHKRTVSSLMETLRGLGHDTDALWEAIGQLVVKTLVAVQPHLEHTYFTCRQRSNDAGFGCFEVLGFDVIFDHQLRPFLIEVNHSPSFTCDSPLDTTVKSAVLKSTMELVSFSKDEFRILKRAGPTPPGNGACDVACAPVLVRAPSVRVCLAVWRDRPAPRPEDSCAPRPSARGLRAAALRAVWLPAGLPSRE